MTRKLVVIPNRSNYVLAWCLEYAINLKSLGFTVDLLDMSRLNARYIQKPNRWLIDNASSRKSTARKKSIKHICNEFGLTDLTSSISLTSKVQRDFASQDIQEYFYTAVRSSYARWFGSSDIEISDIPETLFEYEKLSFIRIYDQVSKLLKLNDYSELSTVNGRFVPDAAAVLAALEAKVPYRVLEKMTEDWSHFVPFTVSAQSLPERDQIIDHEWKQEDKAGREEKISIAVEYLKLRTSEEWAWERNSHAVLPEDIDLKKPYAVFYLTSDWEFPVFGEESSSVFMTQVQSVTTVSLICLENEVQLVVKGHPHPGESRLSAIEDRKWRIICEKLGILYVPCDSGVRSLQLADKSYCNFVHGSTLAIDFVVNKLPVIATTPSDYTTLIPEICAFDEVQIRRLFQNLPKPIEPSRLYSWAFSAIKAGIPMRHFEIREDMQVAFKGELIDQPIRIFIKIRALFARLMSRTGHGVGERF